MKKIYISAISAAAFLICSLGYNVYSQNSGKDLSTVCVMSFNIRADVQTDAPNTWKNRKLWVTNLISKEDVVGLQELMPAQYESLLESPKFKTFNYTTGNDGTGKDGMSCVNAIFFNPEKLKAIEHGTFWLSETPDKASKGWDGKYQRCCNWAKFEISGGKRFYLFNTHLDNEGAMARRNGANLIMRKIREIISAAGDVKIPIIITGDFNCTAESEAIKTICKNPSSKKIVPNHFSNAASVCDKLIDGPAFTYHGWMKIPDSQRATIDFIFAENIKRVCSFWVSNDPISPELPATPAQFPSDHYPVCALIAL